VENPVVVDDYELIQDSGGAGKFRGAQSYVKQITNLGDAATLQLRSDKRKFPPYGLQGGSTGSPSLNILNPGADETLLPTLAQVRLERGGVIRHEMAGGGGWGDPLTRDPTAVLEDVLDGRVSINSAKTEYGVVISEPQNRLDQGATDLLRSTMLQQRESSNS
jgi:N-methylhydantoinase B